MAQIHFVILVNLKQIFSNPQGALPSPPPALPQQLNVCVFFPKGKLKFLWLMWVLHGVWQKINDIKYKYQYQTQALWSVLQKVHNAPLMCQLLKSSVWYVYKMQCDKNSHLYGHLWVVTNILFDLFLIYGIVKYVSIRNNVM